MAASFSGILEIDQRKFGFVRAMSIVIDRSDTDPYVPASLIDRYKLQPGVVFEGTATLKKAHGPQSGSFRPMRQLLRRISSAWSRYRPIDAGCRSVLPRRERALRNRIESFGLAGLFGKGEGLRAQPLSGRIHDCRVGRGLLPISVPAAARPKCRSPCHGDRLDAGLTLAVVPGSRPNQRLCFIPRTTPHSRPSPLRCRPLGPNSSRLRP